MEDCVQSLVAYSSFIVYILALEGGGAPRKSQTPDPDCFVFTCAKETVLNHMCTAYYNNIRPSGSGMHRVLGTGAESTPLWFLVFLVISDIQRFAKSQLVPPVFFPQNLLFCADTRSVWATRLSLFLERIAARGIPHHVAGCRPGW